MKPIDRAPDNAERAALRPLDTLVADQLGSKSRSPLEEARNPTSEFQCSRADSQGAIRAVAGFQLVSCAMPAQFSSRAVPNGGRFAGESELRRDLQIALGPFLAEMPQSAALLTDYLLTSVGDGGVDVRCRLLVESARLPSAQATEQAASLRDELAVCLRVLADWYVFEPVRFSATDRSLFEGSRMCLRAKTRLFAASLSGAIGFAGAGDDRKATRVLLPQPAGAEPSAQSRQQGLTTLLLKGGESGTLMASIRASRGLVGSLPIRIALRRRDIQPEELEALQAVARLLSAATSGDSAEESAALTVTGVAGDQAQASIEQLLTQPECLELSVEAADHGAQGRALLRILGEELFPGFVSEIVVEPQGARRTRKRPPIDLSQVMAPGSTPPPLLAAPPMLESLSFPRHYANPTVDLPEEGLHLGRAHIGGVVVEVRMPHADRSLHMYALGATGTGKSTLLYNMAVQDINAGHGLLVVDPHGDLFEQLLLAVPAHRREDLLVIDLEDERFCPCLNPMDFGGKPDAEAVNRVANDMLAIFDRLYDMKVAGGPIFEDYFRHSMLLAAVAPSSGPLDEHGTVPTLVTVGHVLRNKEFRKLCIARLDQFYGPRAAAEIRQFIDLAQKTSGDTAFENIAIYVSVKLSRFVTNATMRKLFSSGPRTMNFRQIMDERRILLVNLSKGDLGSSDCRLIGMILTKYLFNAALSRSDVPRAQRTPFYFYLDEFQNFVSSDIPDMLAEARKFGVHLVLANQTLGQLTEAGRRETLDAVLGNVATRLFFRVGQTEAAAVEAGFTPYFDDQTLANLPDRHVLCRLQVGGRPSMPFVFHTLSPSPLPTAATVERSLRWAAVNATSVKLREQVVPS